MEEDIKSLKAVVDATANGEISDAQLDELKSGKEKLMNSAQALFAKMYEQAQSAQGAQGAQGAGPEAGAGAGQAADDDVVDADYKEV